MTAVVKTLSGADQFSDEIEIRGCFNFSLHIPTSFVGKVILQRRFSKTDVWREVNTFTGQFEDATYQPHGAFMRFGIKAGDYTSGSIEGRLGL